MESYLVEKKNLKNEYKECFERVESYALLENVDEKNLEEMMMNLVDVLYTAQRKGKPLEKIVGKDMEAFCKSYFSEYHSVIQWVKGFPKWIYRISCLELFFYLFEIAVLWEETDFHLLTATTDVSGYAGGVILGLIVALLSKYIGQNLIFRVKRVNATVVSIISVAVFFICLIPASVFLADKVIAVPLLAVTVLCIVYCIGYKVIELRTRYRKYGTIKKPVEPGSAKAVYQATMEKNIEQWPVELQKTFERKNKKRRRRGKTELTIEKYMEKLRRECQIVKICDGIIRLLLLALCIVPIVMFWMDDGISGAVFGGVILLAIYYGIYKIFMDNSLYKAQEAYLKQCEEEGITILELAERIKEADGEE
ncbi:MAG: DUF1048 domain-containing protein [Lachnospiraceae bacterium]|nr:DUF1048 domain-containing protein [Lachnospiraceae bacterium]